MANPWLSIPLEDYEGHMDSEGVGQAATLRELFHYVLDVRPFESVAVLGVAGGNGLALIDTAVTKRIVGVDINPQYLDEVHKRFPALSGLDLHCVDLSAAGFRLIPVQLVHAALIFEHTGLGTALDNALSLVAPAGIFSVVLQLPSNSESEVACTRYSSMQTLREDFVLVDKDKFQQALIQKGFDLIEQQSRAVPSGKTLWLGLFVRTLRSD